MRSDIDSAGRGGERRSRQFGTSLLCADLKNTGTEEKDMVRKSIKGTLNWGGESKEEEWRTGVVRNFCNFYGGGEFSNLS